MPAWIKADDLGYYVGSFLGLGFWEASELDDCPPIEFESEQKAQDYMNTWDSIPEGIYITLEPPKERE